MLNRLRTRLDAARREEGFTLIELLIVIVILGVLAAVVVFSVSGIKDKGVAAACKSDVASVTTASEAYYAQTGGYAASVPALVTAGLLHSAPLSTAYAITLSPAGAVSVAAGTGTNPIAGADLAACQAVAS